VAHAKQEPDSQNGEAAGHGWLRGLLILPASNIALISFWSRARI
jgi:hypothetical protein